jgi:hypothetical protein
MKSSWTRLPAAWVTLAALLPVLAAAADAPKVKIEAVHANDEMSVVFIQGTGFGAGAPSLTLGGKALQMLTNDGTTIAARLPAGTAPGKYPIVVTRADGKSDRFNAVLPVAPAVPPPVEGRGPTILSAEVNADRTVLTVSGKRFGAGAVTVLLDGQLLQMLGNDGTTVQAFLPTGVAAGAHAVVLTRADGQSVSGGVTVGP